MKRLNEYIEHTQVTTLHEAAMKASGTEAERHISKYLQPDQLKTLRYKMAKDSGGAKGGEEVEVKKVVAEPLMGGGFRYHAHVQHANGTSVVPINHLMKPEGVGRAGKSAEGKEDMAVAGLHQQIQDAIAKSGGKSIKIKHMGKTHTIAGARKVVSGDFSGRKPKGDIILHDEQGKPAIFLSHKASAKATGAQNYEGLSDHIENPQVAGFLSDLQTARKKGLRSGDTFVRKFNTRSARDKALHRSVMFGSQHDSEERGVHNVHSIAHGAVGIAPTKGGAFNLTSDKFINNDETFDHNDHPVEFTARYMTGRKDHGVQNARIGIARIGSRPTSSKI
jgi:hypothetical protein